MTPTGPVSRVEHDAALSRALHWQSLAEQAEAILTRVTERMTEYDQHGSGMVNVRQVLNLLSPTWPDGNYCSEGS
jgi:hypothetical protein